MTPMRVIEANRLARCLGMTPCPCTPIFDLAEQLIGHLRATVVRTYLEGNERGISKPGGDLVQDWLAQVRPADFGEASDR